MNQVEPHWTRQWWGAGWLLFHWEQHCCSILVAMEHRRLIAMMCYLALWDNHFCVKFRANLHYWSCLHLQRKHINFSWQVSLPLSTLVQVSPLAPCNIYGYNAHFYHDIVLQVSSSIETVGNMALREKSFLSIKSWLDWQSICRNISGVSKSSSDNNHTIRRSKHQALFTVRTKMTTSLELENLLKNPTFQFAKVEKKLKDRGPLVCSEDEL